jgi:hypothetical protein
VVVNADLSGVLVKIERAKSHLRDFDLRAKRTEDACRKAVIRERDDERAELVFRFGRVPPLRPVLGAIIGDAIHNLRVALDHLACQLVIATSGTPNDATAFPILPVAPTPSSDGRTRPQIAPGVPKDLREILDEVQPYKLAKPTNHDLMVLHRLDINDKHRELLITVIGVKHFGWFGEANPTGINLGPYEDGSEVCRFPYADLEDQGNFSPTFSFAVRLDEAEAGPWGLMHGASEFVRRRPLRYIEEEVLPRFGSGS